MSHETHWDPAVRELIAAAEARGRMAQLTREDRRGLAAAHGYEIGEREAFERVAQTVAQAFGTWDQRHAEFLASARRAGGANDRARLAATATAFKVCADDLRALLAEHRDPESPSAVTEGELGHFLQSNSYTLCELTARAILAAFHVTRRDHPMTARTDRAWKIAIWPIAAAVWHGLNAIDALVRGRR